MLVNCVAVPDQYDAFKMTILFGREHSLNHIVSCLLRMFGRERVPVKGDNVMRGYCHWIINGAIYLG